MLTIEERKAVATMGRLADALNNFNKEQQGAKKRVYCQEVLKDKDGIADYINKRQKEVGAVITIDHIERVLPTGVNSVHRIVYHYDKPKED